MTRVGSQHHRKKKYLYIYIYLCVCVCVYVCIYRERQYVYFLASRILIDYLHYGKLSTLIFGQLRKKFRIHPPPMTQQP
jgi:phosphoglycerol transferase MdoB-like AlkP superfamily enzyme